MERQNLEINISAVNDKSKSLSGQVKYSELSFFELLVQVREQIKCDSFGPRDRDQAEEIAMLIAEVFRLPAQAQVRIGGNDLPAEMVSEVFEMITSEHVEFVIANYKKADYEIKRTKTYLRTALYNSVFELVSRIENEVRADGVTV